jgi:hypothetical protein
MQSDLAVVHGLQLIPFDARHGNGWQDVPDVCCLIGDKRIFALFFNYFVRTPCTMKKITDYRKLLGVSKTTELKELKTIYRNFMKDWHPDKFPDNEAGKHESEEKSKAIIEAYHFLVSIAPETQAQALPVYTQTTTSSSISDISYESLTLKITFADGSIYEYFDVPRNTYVKLINAESQGRFARRHIYNEFVYRNVGKQVTE